MDEPVPWMWIEPPISAGHGKRRRACQPGIKNCHAYGQISILLIMVVGEHQRSPRLQRLRHALINIREAFGEMRQVRVPRCRFPVSSSGVRASLTSSSPAKVFAHQLAKPHIAEVHELAVLDHAVIRRIGENGVEAPLAAISAGRRARAVNLARVAASGARGSVRRSTPP